MEPEPFSEMMAEFARWGVNVVGGCCGTRPEHLDLLHRQVHGHSYQELLTNRDSLGKAKPKQREPEHEAVASSGMTATTMIQNPGPTLIGERVNSQGSRKVKQLLLADDYEAW
jgi:5-methyltetrahydrofolate--homocysteine methyltransferase